MATACKIRGGKKGGTRKRWTAFGLLYTPNDLPLTIRSEKAEYCCRSDQCCQTMTPIAKEKHESKISPKS